MRTSSGLVPLITLAAAVVLAGCAVQQPVLTPQPTHTPTGRTAVLLDPRVTRSDAALAALVRADRPGCSGAVGVRGTVVWAGATGIANRRTEEPVTTATRFDMASVSKQFTATALLMLARDGELKLSDPVGRYVTGLPAWGSTVSLGQLMHHTSRIPDYWVVLDADGLGFTDAVSNAQTLDAIRRLPSLNSGSGYEYSNSNYVLLAEVIRRVSGQALPEFLDERIFTPLGLDMVLHPGLEAPDIALSYHDDLSFQPPGWDAYGAIGIVTTPSELVRWGDQYRAGDIIQDDFARGAVDEGTGEYYGAGMDIEPDGDLNHNGRFGGYISTFTVSADRQTTIAVMCNGHLSNRFGLADALWAIWGTDYAGDAASADGGFFGSDDR